MAFVIEDGAGVPNSNSYESVEAATAYHAQRGNADWATATNDKREQALIAASDYADMRYHYPGRPLHEDQGLQWPRCDAYDANGVKVTGIPKSLRIAVCEYALRHVKGVVLAPDLTADASGAAVIETMKKVGPIETSTKYSEASRSRFRSYPAADSLLRRLRGPLSTARA